MPTATLKTYQKYRDEIQTGDLIQFAATDFVSRIIRYKTKSAISHSAMAFWMMGPLGEMRLCTLESVIFGLYPIPLSNRTAWYLPHGNMYWHRIRPEWKDDGATAAAKMLKYMGTCYDIKGLLWQAFKRMRLNPAKLWCNEAIALAWSDILGLPDNYIMPYPGEMTGDGFGVYEKEGQLIT
jgi:hypothetical protein